MTSVVTNIQQTGLPLTRITQSISFGDPAGRWETIVEIDKIVALPLAKLIASIHAIGLASLLFQTGRELSQSADPQAACTGTTLTMSGDHPAGMIGVAVSIAEINQDVCMVLPGAGSILDAPRLVNSCLTTKASEIRSELSPKVAALPPSLVGAIRDARSAMRSGKLAFDRGVKELRLW